MKTYEFKIYGLDGVWKDTIESDKLKNDISFTSSTNGPQGQCNIDLNLPINTVLGFINSDIIKIYAFDDGFPTGKLIYTGQIQIIEKKYLANKQSITITAFGLGELLNSLIFQSGGSETFNKTQDPSQTVKDVIDYFNSIYTGGWLSYTGTSIPDFGSNINIDFDFTDCFTALKNIQASTDTFYWYIHADGTVYYRAKTDSNNILHKPTAGSNAQSITTKESIEGLVNFGYIKYSSGDTSYDDATSINTYGRRDGYQNKSNIGDTPSALIAITDFVNENKDVSNQTQIILNKDFTYGGLYIEDIKPGDKITVLNFDGIVDKQIVRINYNPEQAVINLENYLSLNKILF